MSGPPTQPKPQHLFFSDEPLEEESNTSPSIKSVPRQYADRIIERLKSRLGGRNPEVEAPFSVAVYGNWGVGKTSFMRALEASLKENQSAGGMGNSGTSIWFETWRFETEPNLLSPLLAEIISVTAQQIKDTKLKKAALETGKKLFGRVAKAALRTGLSVTEKVTGVRAADLERIGEDFARFYGEADGQFDIAKSETTAFREDFDSLIQLARDAESNENKTKGRLVCIFIDDLDRCDPSQVVRLLEAIKLFLWAKGVVFFLALDQEQVLNALVEVRARERQFNTSIEDLRGEAAAYLEKFFLYNVDLNADTGFVRQAVLPRQRAVLWHDFAAAIEPLGVDSGLLANVRSYFRRVQPNLRKMKRALRWLYFEMAQGMEHEGDFVFRFREMVLEENYPELWHGFLKTLPRNARAAFYRRVFEGLADFKNEDRFETQRMYSILRSLEDERTGKSPESSNQLSRFESKQLSALMGTPFTSLLIKLALADDQSELGRLFDLCSDPDHLQPYEPEVPEFEAG
jgi:hypothetical protein